MTDTSITPSPISGQPARFLFEAQVLGRHTARYFLDESTNYIFVHQPHWLAEAYSDAIAVTDTGILARNIRNIDFCTRFMAMGGLNGDSVKGVDLGAGYGLFVRGMRDRGTNFYWNDPYAPNLFARGFEAQDRDYDIAVAFEVLEHLENPLEYLRVQKSKYRFRRLIFTSTCFTAGQVPPLDWWYWTFETGQHISFFSGKTLDYIASQLAMQVFHLGSDLYFMEDLDIRMSPFRLKLATLAARRRLSLFFGRGSLTFADHVEQRNCLKQNKL